MTTQLFPPSPPFDWLQQNQGATTPDAIPGDLSAWFPGLDISKFAPEIFQETRLALFAGLMASVELLRGRNDRSFSTENKRARDFVTSVDLAAQRSVVSIINRFLPEHQIMAEEESMMPDNYERTIPLWIIDPVDGTTNFVSGFAHCGTSIGVAKDDQLYLGVVVAPFLREVYIGVKGHGSFSTKGRLRVKEFTGLESALVATGFPYLREECRGPQCPGDCLSEIKNRTDFIAAKCGDLRRNGAASIDICHVAEGLLDAYIESVEPWDMAAGYIIAKEAGAASCTPGKVEPQAEYLRCKNLLIGSPAAVEGMREYLLHR